MAYKQKGFSPFTVGKEELERRRKKKLKQQQDLQDKIDKFNQQDPYSVDGDKLTEQIKSYEIPKRPGFVSSIRQLTKTSDTDGGSKISKSDDFIVRTGKSDFKKGKLTSKYLAGSQDQASRKSKRVSRNIAIAKDFQGKKPVDETQEGRTFYDRGDKGAEGKFASSEKARIGYKSKAKLNPTLRKLKSKLFKRSKIKGVTLKEVDPNQNYKESYVESSGKRKTTKKTRRKKGSLNITRDKVKFTRSKKYDFGTHEGSGSSEGTKYTQGYIRKTGEGFLGLQNRKTYVDGKLYTKPKSRLFSKSKIKPPKQKKVKTTKSDDNKGLFANMEAVTVTPKMQSKRERKTARIEKRTSNKANRQQKRADRKKKLLAAANMKSMRNFEEKFN